MVKIEPDAENGLTKTSSADCFQIRSVSKERFIKRKGLVSDFIMEEIEIALAHVLKIT